MARVVDRTETEPQRIPLEDVTDDLWICRCGLSRSQPFCDGSHKLARGEEPGVLYHYEVDGDKLVRRPVVLEARPDERPPAQAVGAPKAASVKGA